MSSDPADYESPRQRRERIFVRRRSRRRYVLVAAAIVLFAFAGIWAFYPVKNRPVVSAEVPLIRADQQPTRKRPSDDGGMTVPDRDSIVLNRAEPSVEQLLPPPETPLPRPATPEPPAAAEPAPPPEAAAPPQEQPASPSAETAAAPTSPAPSAATAPPTPVPLPPERKTARAAAPPPPAPASGKGYRLQLGSVRTPDAANKEWERLKGEQGDLLGTLGFTAARADLGARGIYYRIQAGPIADSAAAERDCNELKRRGVGCILVKP